MLSLFAAAKINLTLKVLGRRADGYHGLESLVAFADIGDQIFVKKADETALSIVGPFAAALNSPEEISDNLVLRALALLEVAAERALPSDIVLQKNLPVASGIGGGSADAAAALRGLAALHELDIDLMPLAAELGADVPVCLSTQAAWMSGIGHDIAPLPALPDADIVLVNPRLAVATASVFSALDASEKLRASAPAPQAFADVSAWLAFLKRAGNDLQAAAISLAPEIADCLAGLEKAGAPMHAMSGSGATCFALCPPGQGKALAARYRTLRDKDWVMAGRLISAGDAEIDHPDERVAGIAGSEQT